MHCTIGVLATRHCYDWCMAACAQCTAAHVKIFVQVQYGHNSAGNWLMYWGCGCQPKSFLHAKTGQGLLHHAAPCIVLNSYL